MNRSEQLAKGRREREAIRQALAQHQVLAKVRNELEQLRRDYATVLDQRNEAWDKLAKELAGGPVFRVSVMIETIQDGTVAAEGMPLILKNALTLKDAECFVDKIFTALENGKL